ncbi:MAG TPA: hypothetical protein VI389_03880 [Geobacteraceae bacterium]
MNYMRLLLGAFGLAAATLIMTGSAEPDQSTREHKDFRKQRLWSIENTKTVGNGTMSRTPQGSLVDRITMEGEASSGEGATALKGKFTMILSVFTPEKDMAGQKKGHWYVRGDWTISDPLAPPEQLKYRHTPAVVKGTMNADLRFNPLKAPGQINGYVRLVSGKKGIFAGSEKFEGNLKISP